MARLFRTVQGERANRRDKDVTMDIGDELRPFLSSRTSSRRAVVIELKAPREPVEQRTVTRRGRTVRRMVPVRTLTEQERAEAQAVKAKARDFLGGIVEAPLRELTAYPAFVTEVTPEELKVLAASENPWIRAVQPDAEITLPSPVRQASAEPLPHGNRAR